MKLQPVSIMVWNALAKWFALSARSLEAQRYVPALQGGRGVPAWYVATTIPLPGGGMLVFPLSEVFVHEAAAYAAWDKMRRRVPQAAIVPTTVAVDYACDDHCGFLERHHRLQAAAAEGEGV